MPKITKREKPLALVLGAFLDVPPRIAEAEGWRRRQPPVDADRLPDSKTDVKVVHLGDQAIAMLCGITSEEGNP